VRALLILAKSRWEGWKYNRARFAPVAMSIHFLLPIMPKIMPSFRWSLLAIALGLSACKARLPETTADSAAPARFAGSAAPAQAQSPPPPARTAPAAATIPVTVQSASSNFDISAIPITQQPMPPFPYLDWPSELPVNARSSKVEEFDRRYVVAGQKALPVEGHIEWRDFSNADAKLSMLGSQRNYENALRAIGAVKIDAVYPFDDKTTEPNGGPTMGIHEKFHLTSSGSYSAWLIRAPDKNVWIALSVNDGHTKIMTIEEKAMKQSVGVLR
jgi:OOP family OmpA-OmpF porin